MTNFVYSQVLAGIAFAFGIASFQFKPRRKLLLCLCASSLFNACHFFLLGRSGPATLLIIIASRFLTAAFTTNRKFMYPYLAIVLGAFLITFKTPLSFIALFATLLGTYASFQPSDRFIRIANIVGVSCWIIHNVIARSPAAVAMEVSFLASNVIGYRRFYVTRRDSNPVPKPVPCKDPETSEELPV